jgi:nucleobase:cation symporter-1, NCS1 family
VGINVGEYPHLHVGSGSHPGGNELETSHCDRVLGQCHCLHPYAVELAPGHTLRNTFPRVGAVVIGVLGANVAAVLRALVACGWFEIQTWIGGEAINSLVAIMAPGWAHSSSAAAICFLAFWFINLAVILKGIDYIRFLQGMSAPVLLFCVTAQSLNSSDLPVHITRDYKKSDSRRL